MTESASTQIDFIDRIREHVARVRQVKQQGTQLATEEATKMALVVPFIGRVLGYDVFNPVEVIPEFTADFGTKKGEKVDYAIMRDGAPVILIECKQSGAALNVEQESQLFRYFTVTQARLGVLTDGIRYKIFSDLEKPHIMDSKPFVDFSLDEFDESLAPELYKFTKPVFEIEAILATASDLKYTREIRRVLG